MATKLESLKESFEKPFIVRGSHDRFDLVLAIVGPESARTLVFHSPVGPIYVFCEELKRAVDDDPPGKVMLRGKIVDLPITFPKEERDELLPLPVEIGFNIYEGRGNVREREE